MYPILLTLSIATLLSVGFLKNQITTIDFINKNQKFIHFDHTYIDPIKLTKELIAKKLNTKQHKPNSQKNIKEYKKLLSIVDEKIIIKIRDKKTNEIKVIKTSAEDMFKLFTLQQKKGFTTSQSDRIFKNYVISHFKKNTNIKFTTIQKNTNIDLENYTNYLDYPNLKTAINQFIKYEKSQND